MFTLLNHLLKEKVRTLFWKKSIVLSILVSLFILYFIGNFLFIGYFADKILSEIFPDGNIIKEFTRILFYYFMLDFVARFKFQDISLVTSNRYLLLPIPRKKLFHFPLLLTAFSPFNIFFLLLTLPFFSKVIIHESLFFSITWFACIYSCLAIMNYGSVFVKLHFRKNIVVGLSMFALVAGTFFLEYKDYISIAPYLYTSISFASNYFGLFIVPVLLAIWVYQRSYKLLYKNRFNEALNNDKKEKLRSLSFLDRYGEYGNLINLELKFIFRNAKTKKMFFLSILFCFYGFLFYKQEDGFNLYNFRNIFVGIFILSSFAINFGQIALSGYSSFFSGMRTQAISFQTIFKIKYTMYAIAMVLAYLISMIYLIIDIRIAYINFSLLLYSLGVLPFIYLYIANYIVKPFNVSSKQQFDFQGFNLINFLPFIPLLLIPYVIYGICNLFGWKDGVFYILGGIGTLGILTRNYWLKVIFLKFQEQKYKLSEGFKQG